MYTLHRVCNRINSVWYNYYVALHNDLTFSSFPVPVNLHGIYGVFLEENLLLFHLTLSFSGVLALGV